MFDNFPAGQIEHFTQGIVVGEAGLVFGNLPELAVQALDDIGRVYDFPNLGGIWRVSQIVCNREKQCE